MLSLTGGPGKAATVCYKRTCLNDCFRVRPAPQYNYSLVKIPTVFLILWSSITCLNSVKQWTCFLCPTHWCPVQLNSNSLMAGGKICTRLLWPSNLNVHWPGLHHHRSAWVCLGTMLVERDPIPFVGFWSSRSRTEILIGNFQGCPGHISSI